MLRGLDQISTAQHGVWKERKMLLDTNVQFQSKPSGLWPAALMEHKGQEKPSLTFLFFFVLFHY
jgi:hypothetical protein